jgi:nicotinate-nucleotide adenylyltransferase
VTGTSAIDQPLALDRPSVGILGGTFNPPHLGHLALAHHAHEELGLQRVVLMPAHVPLHKPTDEDPGAEHRLRMCRRLVDDASGVSVCALEVERGGPSYTVDTLKVIHASHPDVQLTFIVGADTASTLPAWREPAKLLELADLAVAARAGYGRREVLDAVAPLATAFGGDAPAPQAVASDRRSGGVRFLEMPVMEISSSAVRRRVARGEPVENLVGPTVARYIAEHGLYRGRREAGS